MTTGSGFLGAGAGAGLATFSFTVAAAGASRTGVAGALFAALFELGLDAFKFDGLATGAGGGSVGWLGSLEAATSVGGVAGTSVAACSTGFEEHALMARAIESNGVSFQTCIGISLLIVRGLNAGRVPP